MRRTNRSTFVWKQLMNNPAMQMSLFTMPYKWSPATLHELIGTTNQVGYTGEK